MKTLSKFLIALFFLNSFGCKKKKETPVPEISNPSCCVTEMDNIDFGTKTYYYYDSKHRISQEKQYDYKDKLTYIKTYLYSDNQVLYSYFDSTNATPSASGTLFLGGNGFVEKEILTSKGKTFTGESFTEFDTITYLYNNDGYLLKKNQASVFSYPDSTTRQITSLDNTWTEGNIISNINTLTKYNNDGSLNSYKSYNNTNTYLDIPATADLNLGFSLYGKTSKNLIKSSVSPESRSTYLYTIDANGNVLTKTTSTTLGYVGPALEPYDLTYKIECY